LFHVISELVAPLLVSLVFVLTLHGLHSELGVTFRVIRLSSSGPEKRSRRAGLPFPVHSVTFFAHALLPKYIGPAAFPPDLGEGIPPVCFFSCCLPPCSRRGGVAFSVYGVSCCWFFPTQRSVEPILAPFFGLSNVEVYVPPTFLFLLFVPQSPFHYTFFRGILLILLPSATFGISGPSRAMLVLIPVFQVLPEVDRAS